MRLPERYEHIDAVKVGDDVRFRSNLTDELYNPHEIHALLDDLASYNGHGASEIDPFEEPEPTQGILDSE